MSFGYILDGAIRLLDIREGGRVVFCATHFRPNTNPRRELTMTAIVNKRNVGSITILELGPRLTLVEGTELRDAVTELLAEGRASILLDCARVTFMDSQGIGLLIRTWMSVGRHGRLKLFSVAPRLKETLQITGLLKVMECFDDVGAALQSFSQHASA